MVKNKANLIIVLLTVIILVVVIASIRLVKSDYKIDENNSIDVNIKSKILKDIIKNNWNSEYGFGTKESTFDNYDIYFDEGLEVKNIDNQIYNIVFTEKYTKKILENVKANDNLDDIIEELGNPAFGGKSIDLIGYEYDDFYIFFNGKQASIYSKQKSVVSQDIFNDSYTSNEEFINILSQSMNNYDQYIVKLDGEDIQYALINYTNNGFRVNVVNNNIDITVYNNCNFKIPQNDIYTVKTKNKNLVYEVETERQNSIHNTEHIYEQYQLSQNNLPPDFEEIGPHETDFKTINSEVFIDIQTDMTNDGEYNLKFICINGKYPNFELDELVYSSSWVDNFNIAYSIKNKGVYLYNIKTKEKITLKEGKSEFYIYGVTKENKLRVDDFEINI